MNKYQGMLRLVKELERLKNNTRTAWTSEGRTESVAEHSWRLAMFALVLEDDFPDVDVNRVIRLGLVHDLGEAYEGDISAKIPIDPVEKLKKEEDALSKLLAPLPENERQKILALCREYNLGESPEAKLAKALDKMETIIQHNQGNNPGDFDYEFNLQYGQAYTNYHPAIHRIREMIDEETRNRIRKEEQGNA